jgi:hypothetical protein
MFDHEIKSICISYPDYRNQKDLLVKYLICDCSNSMEKKLVVAFCGTSSIYDLFAESENYFNENQEEERGSLKDRIFKRSESIPIEYFLEKLSKGYKIIFTGHLLGASVAALVTTRLLLNSKREYKKILFIGFGCPLIADETFKHKIEKNFKQNFHFIRDENDTFVDLLSICVNLFYSNKKELQSEALHKDLFEATSTNSPRIVIEAIKWIKTFLTFAESKNLNNFTYEHFGIKMKLNAHGLKIESSPAVVKDDYKFYLSEILKKKLKYFSMNDYFERMKADFFTGETETILGQPRVRVSTLNDLFVPESEWLEIEWVIASVCNNKMASLESNYSVCLVINEYETDIFIRISCRNLEYIVLAAVVFENDKKKSNNQPEFIPKQIDKCRETNSLTFKFACSNEKILKNENVLSQNINFKLVTYFNPLVEFTILINKEKAFKGMTQKESAIMDMPIDLLYLHAAYYVDTFRRLKDEVFRKRCVKILEIFDKIDQIWNLNGKSHKMDTPELQSLLASYLINDNLSKNKDIAGISSIINSFKVDKCYNYISLADHVKGKNSENDKENFLHCLIPTIYEIKKKVYNNYGRYKLFHVVSRNYVSLVYSSNAILLLVPYVLFNNKSLDEKYRHMLLILSGQLSHEAKVVLPCLGLLEKNVKSYTSDKDIYDIFDFDKRIIKNISLNYALREILCQDVLVGCIGKKKCGKSTFVELITNCQANANAIKATEFISPYKLCESLILFDYPHFNSQDVSHKIQFYFTRSILDYVFMLDKVMDSAETEDTHAIYDILTKRSNRRFSLIFNRLDDVLTEIRKTNDTSGLIEKLRDNIFKRLGIDENDLDMKKRIHLTIMDRNNLNFEDLDRLAMANYLDAVQLKMKTYEIILEYLPKNLEKYARTREEILTKMGGQILEGEIRDISVEYDQESSPIQFKITLDPRLAKETKPKVYCDFKIFINMIKTRFDCEENIIEIRSKIKPNIAFYNMEDLFKSNFRSFMAIGKK